VCSIGLSRRLVGLDDGQREYPALVVCPASHERRLAMRVGARNCGARRALARRTSQEHGMPTQLRLFSANGAENFPKLEKEVNDWLTAKGNSIQPVNSQTATCALADGGNNNKVSQAVIVALWYLDPVEPE
jgi:hypothetical protein